jgi:hypothetical protein
MTAKTLRISHFCHAVGIFAVVDDIIYSSEKLTKQLQRSLSQRDPVSGQDDIINKIFTVKKTKI